MSVVVPTRNEADNVEPLLERLLPHLPPGSEVLFVDDSEDETPERISQVARRDPRVRLLHRPPGARDGGLGGAVLAGFRAARCPWIAVMDADLQHPPELLPRLLAAAQVHRVPLVIASRYRDDGRASGLRFVRLAVSRASTTLARLAFPFRLRNVTDPMSGFFLVQRDQLQLDDLRPRGFKILLEILVRHPHLRVAEVSYVFGRRYAGRSKASLREGLQYLGHLATLRLGEEPARFAGFAAIGATGLVVNTLALFALVELGNLHYLAGAAGATLASSLWNYTFTDRLVFPDRRDGRHWTTRLSLFTAANVAGLAIRGPLLFLLTSIAGIYYLLSNILSLGALAVLRFGVSTAWIWPTHRRSYAYDLHGILSVQSPVRLPELERFRVERVDAPDVKIELGGLRSPGPFGRFGWVDVEPTADQPQRIRYDDGLGPFGFWFEANLDLPIRIAVSPALRHSPHVLYTNVLEPILRWCFVRRGYALVHAACIAAGDCATLITARTDTGKTTTVLRILQHQRRANDRGAFLADDLTLLRSDGLVLSYPKPLTISRHTVAAVPTARLSRRQRLALLVQSRIHSRTGRRLALMLASTRLPVATINLYAQWLVPPPKYHVEQLIPQVRSRTAARLTRVVVIERGHENARALESSETLRILLENGDDAYGFPPYPAIRPFLTRPLGQDLTPAERAIVATALQGVTCQLLRRSALDWWRPIAAEAGLNGQHPPEEARYPLPIATTESGLGG
ncbi:MAG: glycosyltransferase family 2 protein [Thermomicrobium sp.]|nr:glycosyltransferase family 2 protein [Thermomicrobium sp.]MDW8005547.1 glycosyltransferase family 2 protein [Thermomicrobium sp.]